MPVLSKPNLIIQIRGTSGSGKTTAMRKVLESLGVKAPVCVPGRRNPLFYHYSTGVFVLGSYESTCGGCDTIHGYPLLLETVDRCYKMGHVLMEGLLLSEDVKQTLSLLPRKLKIIFLNTPVEECIRRVKLRREEAGNEKPLNENNTRKRVATIDRARNRLMANGVECFLKSSEEAPEFVLKLLGK